MKTPGQLAGRLAEPVARLGEAQVPAEPYEDVTAWFERLEAVLALAEGAWRLAPSQTEAEGASTDRRRSAAPSELVAQFPAPLEGDSRAAALKALGDMLPALRATALTHRGASARQFPGTDTARLLAGLDPGSYLRRWDHRGGLRRRGRSTELRGGAVPVTVGKGRRVAGRPGPPPPLQGPAGVGRHFAPLTLIKGEGSVVDLRLALGPLASSMRAADEATLAAEEQARCEELAAEDPSRRRSQTTAEAEAAVEGDN
ncbi:hypothetical protein [Streptomyces venetus]|uniref:hypothetical protein n=1 Tax=Streptomyces venetus TaxID=1701086 RepID=UPI003C2E782D